MAQMGRFDLHTIRQAESRVAAEIASIQDNWALVGIDGGGEETIYELSAFLEELGKNVFLICPECGLCNECSDPMTTIGNRPIFKSVELIDEPVDVLSIHGNVDYWFLTTSISQRMQWYGDIKVICSSAPEDERWVSEMFDYGIAVANFDEIINQLENQL